MQSVQEWQHPFVDVFKKYNSFQCPKSFKGNVTIIHDPNIARKCFKLSGSILSNNTVNIPQGSQSKECNLNGRYIYIQFQPSPEKFFSIHFQIAIKDREPGVRFTFTNMEKQYTVTGGNTLKIPYFTDKNLWTIVCIDIEHHLQNFGLFSKGVIQNYGGVHTIKAIQLCSNMNIRGIYTSSNVYDWNSLPKQMSFKLVKGARWSEHYNFLYLPNDIDPAEVRKKLKEAQVAEMAQFPHTIVERQETTRKRKGQSLIPNQSYPKATAVLTSDPYLQLKYVFSFSSLYNPDLIFKDSKVYYSAGSILVSKDINTGEQQFMQGHTDYIVAMDSHQDWIVTVQQGAKTAVRIWIDNKCISSFQCPYQKVQQVRLSHKKHLAMVGLDSYKRQAILIFDISEVETTRKPVLLAKQISDFNILTIKFSPVQTDKLVSCGKENIRFWRVKNEHLPGSPVILNHHARNTVFTVFDFQYFFDDPNPIKQKSQIKRVYVGSQTGLLFQINYATHELQEVYKLHQNAAISSIVVSCGFCITGSEDQLLRVWQMDFNEYILEAGNDGVVTSLVLSDDAMLVACGTSTGTLSILDLNTNNYNTIVRSHTQNVTKIVYHKFSNCMITVSKDLTIRLWDPQKMEQTYQFSYPTNDPCLCLSGNPNSLFFAAGFQSGMLRIFDIENTCVIEEIKHHSTAITHIEYSPDGRFLAVLQKSSSMIYSPLHSHQPVKHLPIEMGSKYNHCSFSQESDYLAIIGDSGTHINIWQLRSLHMIGKIFCGKIIKKLRFEKETLWAIFEDTSTRRYNTNKMTIEVQMQALHRQNLNGIDFHHQQHLLFSVGDDSLVKVWDYSFLREPHQVYIGHANQINDLVYHRNKLWTVGSEGILVWDFKELDSHFVPPPIFIKQKKANFIKNSIVEHREQQNISERQASYEESSQLKETVRESSPPPKQNKILFSNLMKRNAGQSQQMNKFAVQKIEMKFSQKTTNFRKIKKREPKPKLLANLPQVNIQHSLPLKHFFQSEMKPNQIEYLQKVQLIKQNTKRYKLQYLIGFESNAHEHVVWNFMYGWIGYIYDNLIIIESLNKNRTQKIITMPQKLGSLALSKDFKKLICFSQFNPLKKEKVDLDSSDSGSQASSDEGETGNQSASIYILNGGDYSIEKKLQFHPKGIQSISINSNNKYLVSIGNFRECTVCVWDIQFGKIKASSYTLDKLNDLSIMERVSEGRLLQFATVGRDQIHFWGFTKDQKLEYYDVFIPKLEDQEEVPQLTSCDYLYYEDTPYLMCGTATGEIILVRYGDFVISWRRKVCSGQIMSIKCFKNRCVVGSADGNLYFWNYSATILDAEPTPSFSKLNLTYTVTGMHFDPEGNQGVVSTCDAIYYVNLSEQFSSLLVGNSPQGVILVQQVMKQYLMTSHKNGRMKLWNIESCEQLKSYKWKFPCTQAYYDESISKLVCFCTNQTVKLVNLKKFTKQQNYLPEEYTKPEVGFDDYVIYSTMVNFGDRPERWVFFKKGSIFSFEIVLEGRKKLIKMVKNLQIPHKLRDISAFSDKNLILATNIEGEVMAYNVDNLLNKYSLLLVDQAKYQQFYIEGRNKPQQRQDLPSQGKHVQVAISKVLNETYLAIGEQSQYVYFRNYMKRVTFQKILLGGIPSSITLNETRKDSQVILGMKQGGIIGINTIDPDKRIRYEGVVNDTIDSLYNLKSKNWLIAVSPKALAFYSKNQ